MKLSVYYEVVHVWDNLQENEVMEYYLKKIDKVYTIDDEQDLSSK